MPQATTSHRRRRVLIVSRVLPEPADDGYRIRVRELAKGLARVADVTMVGHAEGDGRAAAEALAREGIEAHAAPMLHHQTRIRRLRRLATGRTWFTRSAEDPGLQLAFERSLEHGPFDLIQLESSEFAGLSRPPGVPTLIDEHNIWSELSERRRRLRVPGPGSVGDRLEAARVAAIEERAWREVAGVAFCSEREVTAAALRVPARRFVVVPNGVDLERFQPRDAPAGAAEERGRITVVGLRRYTPNVDAVRWFARSILPVVHESAPEATFVAVGKSPSPGLRALSSSSIQVLGTVPDVRPELERASVVVAPLRAGSGTRIKILQAFAMEKAVVSTSLGAEGLPVRDREHLLLADDPREFASAVVELLHDPQLRRRLGAAGRALVVDGFGWARSVERLDAFQRDLLAAPRATGGERPQTTS
jgi:glycosyltransferase involved in cell wall biosynthesis